MKKILFWILQLTWGILDNLLGLLVFLVLIVKYKPKRFHQMIYFEVGENWGGVNFGWLAVVNKNPSEHTLRHEHGHFIQNLIFGPVFWFIVAIPSATRYWYREYIYRTNPEKYYKLPEYDSIWFEGQATRFGYKYLK